MIAVREGGRIKMKLELVLPNDQFLTFVRAFETGAWSVDGKPTLTLQTLDSDPSTTPAQRSVEQIGGVAFTISILTPALKILAGVIKSYLEARKTQLEIRSGTKKIAISGPSSSVEEILARLQELDSPSRK